MGSHAGIRNVGAIFDYRPRVSRIIAFGNSPSAFSPGCCLLESSKRVHCRANLIRDWLDESE